MILNMNCLQGLKGFPDNSFDSIVTDPPYELGFMGKHWDSTGIANNVELWKECLRVLKPGGVLLSFAAPRTYHRMTCAIEDAGFEIRDQIMWVYGSGFPKSLNVSKAFDKAAGTEWDVTGGEYYATVSSSDLAKQWNGWGTALKPAHEPICVARKPLIGTVLQNIVAHGTGVLNIDGCRVPFGNESDSRVGTDFVSNGGDASNNANDNQVPNLKYVQMYKDGGRFPANFIHDGSDEVLSVFPEAKGQQGDLLGHDKTRNIGIYGHMSPALDTIARIESDKSAARFFYCAKASKADRDEGLEDFEIHQAAGLPMRSADGGRGGKGLDGSSTDRMTSRANTHPTVKPTELMRYLCRLVTPPNGSVLDPFAGSGSTGKAAVLDGFTFIGFELEPGYAAIAQARIDAVRAK